MTGVRVCAAAIAVVLAASAAAAADAARGKELFIKVGCYECHGTQGQGGLTGPRLAPDPLPPEALANFIRGSAPTLMPPYSEKVLGDADVADIQAYLASIPKPPNPKEIPLLNNP